MLKLTAYLKNWNVRFSLTGKEDESFDCFFNYYLSTVDLSISSFNYKIEDGSKLYEKFHH